MRVIFRLISIFWFRTDGSVIWFNETFPDIDLMFSMKKCIEDRSALSHDVELLRSWPCQTVEWRNCPSGTPSDPVSSEYPMKFPNYNENYWLCVNLSFFLSPICHSLCLAISNINYWIMLIVTGNELPLNVDTGQESKMSLHSMLYPEKGSSTFQGFISVKGINA